MITFIKQRPVLSGIIAIVVLAMIALIALMNSGIYGDIIFLFFAWIALMVIGGLCFLVAGIAMLLKSREKIWKQLLLVGLWILLVGGGACGLLSLLMLMIVEIFFDSMLKHPNFSPETAVLLHFIFEWSAVFIGAWLYRRQATINDSAKASLGVLIGCLAGAGIGNKLLFIIEVPQAVAEHGWLALAMGQTIVGGLLGGLIGVEIAKKIIGVKQSTGDRFVVPLAVAMVIGRIGCFLAGLHDGTYGVATTLPWGVDFGDGIARHPTQIYDQLFIIAWVLILRHFAPRLSTVSGLQFKLFLAGYLVWRLLVDGIKPIPYDYAGLSGIQWACVVALLIYLPVTYRAMKPLL